MKFGLIGYGLWGQHHAKAIVKAKGATLTGIAVSSAETEAKAKADYPDVPIYRGYQNLLDQTEIDAISIASPAYLHVEMGVAALNAGKDVLLEKPMAATVEGCDLLLEAAAKNNRILTIGHELRLSKQWAKLEEIISEGQIGDPQYAMVSLFRFPYRPASGGWRYDQSRVGSWILEEPIHFFDLLMWYFEKWGDPVSIQAFGNSKGREPGLYDNFSAILRWPNDLYAVFSQALTGFEHHQTMEITGSDGALRTWWSGIMDRTLEPTFGLNVKSIGKEENETIHIPKSGELFELDEQMEKVVEAFRERRAIVSGIEGRRCVYVCNEAVRSVEEGRMIELHFN